MLTRVVIAAMARGVMRACSPSKPQQQQSMSKPFRMSSREAYSRVMICEGRRRAAGEPA